MLLWQTTVDFELAIILQMLLGSARGCILLLGPDFLLFCTLKKPERQNICMSE